MRPKTIHFQFSEIENGIFEIQSVVEKPAIDQAPSNFALVGRYVLSPRIFASLEKRNCIKKNPLKFINHL
jgi:UTP--glucose-1-phosphate uridylyltransferase